MNIFINVNDNYLKYAAVMLFSLRKNNPDDEIKVYLLFADISENHLNDFDRYLNKLSIELHPVRIERSLFGKFPETGRWTLETYFRLLVPMMADDFMDRCLYIDADTIIDGSISELYNMDFSGKSLVACEDIIVMNDRKDDVVFNAGVMLMNLQDIRKDYSFDRISLMIVNNPEKYPMLDQDLLNEIYSERVLFIDPEIYNRQVDSYDADANRNATIYHYSLSPKPWMANGNNEYFRLWWEYANKCEFYTSHV